MQISKHIKTSEIDCNCGCGFGTHEGDLSQEIINAFERIRARCSESLGIDTAIIINSGCRCGEPTIEHPEYTNYNAKIGSTAKNHPRGEALDPRCPLGMLYPTFYNICEEEIGDRGGVGKYTKQWFVHIDCRGKRARWGK